VLWIPGNHEADDAGIVERTFGSPLAGKTCMLASRRSAGFESPGLAASSTKRSGCLRTLHALQAGECFLKR